MMVEEHDIMTVGIKNDMMLLLHPTWPKCAKVVSLHIPFFHLPLYPFFNSNFETPSSALSLSLFIKGHGPL